MKCQQNMEFIRQALIDFGSTLPPSARAAYDQVAQQHFDAVAAELRESGDEETEHGEE